VQAKVLDAQWLGVPQRRQRLIFVGVREDLDLPPAHPETLPYQYSISDACPWIGDESKEGPEVEPDAWIGQYAIGDEWDNLRLGGQSEKYFSLVRPHPNKPCPTVTQAGKATSTASVTHPTEKRKFSIAELRRIQGFPDDFELAGSYAQRWERLARTVPPVMMKHIAATIRDEILDQL